MDQHIYGYPKGLDFYDRMIYEHLRTELHRCPYVHAMTLEQTTCPVVLDLARAQKDHPRPFNQDKNLRFREEEPPT